MLALLLLACGNENALKTQNEHEGYDSGSEVTPPFTAPELVADPGWIAEDALCGARAFGVTLENTGDADLVVAALDLVGEGWTLEPVTLPLTLAPGARQPLRLTTTGGSATLRVQSNDPGNATLEIPLDASVDLAPSVVIDTPAASATLATGGSTFEARLADDVDAPEALSLRWISDIDGVVGTDAAGADGVARLTWDPAVRTSGPHTIVLEATDSCGNVATTEVSVCQQAGYVADSLDLSTWHFEGSALWDSTNRWVQLTDASYNQAGTAFQTGAAVSADNVNVSFAFYVSGGSGADGISVTALDTERMTGFVGGSGGGIGYLGMPGWSLEVDTWYNGENNDPTGEDHISFHVDGNVASYEAWATLPEMEDGAWHQMDLTVVGTRVRAAIDGVTYIDQDIPRVTPFNAYVGFTAATGGATNAHLIDALEVTEYVCPE
jgi:hypothetical protein